MVQHEHTWSNWVVRDEYIIDVDGVYYVFWHERWCILCKHTEYKNYKKRKVARG